ncbi:MAG: tryptophan synthase subunit alpha [SAR202 cluster bacterium]|jgi:tryptophan synthase alpha chain|nr:tryptophan synthase subunit alpha [Chloroflexota bacterium]MDP6664775.1 tryptophan synthase subunit alpha [SAR202 cluster bacterium]HAL49504.1 tryptophan synthase subunit alpha [Dehalococcoidia bacterium]MDP6801198.1 tryptophan synthase subunit alpha [SAR202 cluster bacterium]MQG59208.1 tryptophan synthase subunit alpha [SAR202 cluster bacterium]|tara:strand:+ start:3008 stop:3814 length:807 start_codon:yes stop_codon:yes gene_type:complete
MPNRIDTTFQRLRSAGQSALAPFVTVGFPDVPTSEALAKTVLDAGGDMLELGIPFSDPLADGPTIQMTSYEALKHGVNVASSIEFLTRLRASGVEAPLVFMGYYNPFLRYGVERFLADASSAGLDGIIVPDLPTEEAGDFRAACNRAGIHMIPLLAPTSPDSRIEESCKGASGFIYCVSLAGVTGARSSMSSGVSDLVGRIRRHTDLPVLVGFGVSQREHVEQISEFADGVIVASALLDAVAKSPAGAALDTARQFVRGLKGLNGTSD